MLYSIHRFPESFVRDRLQLKDEEAEIELTGSRLEEEANMAEIEEDYGDSRPRIDGFFKRTFYERLLRFLTILPH